MSKDTVSKDTITKNPTSDDLKTPKDTTPPLSPSAIAGITAGCVAGGFAGGYGLYRAISKIKKWRRNIRVQEEQPPPLPNPPTESSSSSMSDANRSLDSAASQIRYANNATNLEVDVTLRGFFLAMYSHIEIHSRNAIRRSQEEVRASFWDNDTQTTSAPNDLLQPEYLRARVLRTQDMWIFFFHNASTQEYAQIWTMEKQGYYYEQAYRTILSFQANYCRDIQGNIDTFFASHLKESEEIDHQCMLEQIEKNHLLCYVKADDEVFVYRSPQQQVTPYRPILCTQAEKERAYAYFDVARAYQKKRQPPPCAFISRGRGLSTYN